MDKIYFVIPLVLVLGVGIGLSVQVKAEENLIPSWIKNTAKFWVDDQVSDTEFLNALQYLVNLGILVVPTSENIESNSNLNVKIPSPSEVFGRSEQWEFPTAKFLPRQEDLGNDWKLGTKEDYTEPPTNGVGGTDSGASRLVLVGNKTTNYEPQYLEYAMKSSTDYNYFHEQYGRIGVTIVQSDTFLDLDTQFVDKMNIYSWKTIKLDNPIKDCVFTVMMEGVEGLPNKKYVVTSYCFVDDYFITISGSNKKWDNAVQPIVMFTKIVRDKINS